MTSLENRAVLFIDLLGFGALTEQNPLDIAAISQSQILLAGGIDHLLAADRNPLTRAFKHFHHTMKWAIELAQMKHTLTAITFSDCAFVATDKLSDAVDVATYILQSLLRARVPARGGIACGTFSAVRFRSDVSLHGGDHSAHFLGSAVVRSNAAESCGIKGLRILLHPSAAALLHDEADRTSRNDKPHFIECAPDECSNELGVRFEIDYWRFKPTEESKAWHALQDMWAAAPQHAQRHYEATAQAIDRMRVAQGAQPLLNIRRRTLPRKAMEV